MSGLRLHVDGTGILMAFGPGMPVPEAFLPVVREIAAARGREPRFLMVNTIPPGVSSPKHVDPLYGLELERWHLPVVTNQDAWFWSEATGKFHMDAGYWHGPVAYWKEHQVGNDGSEPRTHLVVDLS